MLDKIKQKAFVYDTTRGYARFIKSNFSDTYLFDCCVTRNKFIEFDLNKYKIGFVMINQYEELLDFLKIKKNIDIIFVTARDIEVQRKLIELEDVYFVDPAKMKKDIINDIVIKINFFNQTA